MRRFLFVGPLALAITSGAVAQFSATPGVWPSYGGNAQHTANFLGTSQPLSQVHWSASLDDNRSYYGSEVLIHYSSPLVTGSNNLIHSYRYTSSNNGTPYYDNWEIMARSGVTGQLLWSGTSDYSAPVVYPKDWTSVFPMCLATVRTRTTVSAFIVGTTVTVSSTALVAAGSGGTLMVKNSADSLNPSFSRYAFYTTQKDYLNNAVAYAPVKINTPLTADGAGNVYFGYVVTGTVPSNLSSLGTGGIAEVNVSSGASTFIAAKSLNISSSLGQLSMNAAPAISNDGAYVYAALCPPNGGAGYLAKLNTGTLTLAASVTLKDPSVKGGAAQLINESSASPMVGPDGNIFMGVFRYNGGESHGWMLQFDQNLSQTNAAGATYPIGAFGWDDTASIVPASIVPSYTGKASYLILSKYNNYLWGGDSGANGANNVGILDPTSNTVSKDRQTGIPVMNEVLLVLSPTLTPTAQFPNARNEWCINSAVVDVPTKSAIINCEDGHVYRWDFTTNTLSQGLALQPATGEAYTSTVIGPDGQIYAINNSIIFAIGK